jgi:hypothetical protein
VIVNAFRKLTEKRVKFLKAGEIFSADGRKHILWDVLDSQPKAGSSPVLF